MSNNMTNQEPQLSSSSDTSGNIFGLMEEPMSYFPSFFDDPFYTGDFNNDSLWVQSPNTEQELINSTLNYFATNDVNAIATLTSTTTTPTQSIISNQSELQEFPKKRKKDDCSKVQVLRKNTKQHAACPGTGGGEQAGLVRTKKPTAGKKGNKVAGNSSNGGNSKEGRWAEQLLNPCAVAITARNTSRVQHFLYVLHELSSLKGDVNHRLAFYGLRALTHYLSTFPGSTSVLSANSCNFSSSNPNFFKDSLMKFNDNNPWFRIPDNIANTSILQILGEQSRRTNLHILDIGVSHGFQWPTLLTELASQDGGPPPLVRITVVAPFTNDAPFANGPQNYDFSSKLVASAKTMNINLQINKIENFALQHLNSEVINSSDEETLIICAQFRLHNLNHNFPDERTEFLRVLRSLGPKGVILSENNTECSCCNCGDFATGFLRRVEYLWKFLDSSRAAYRGWESDERRMMEAEAAKVLVNSSEMNESKEKWCERMKNVGFKREVFGEETVDGAKTLLRKYDNNWEISTEEGDSCIELCWKGQPVSFCSLWKMDLSVEDCLAMT